MKTLENYTLLYDDDCPLCNVYTSGFIKSRMLDGNGRKPFKKITNDEKIYVDIKRATNEIALVDTKSHKVIYGIDSLLKVIGNSFPFIERVGKFKPIYFFLKKLYSFISYNRKVIIPSEIKENESLECIPDFNIKYRVLYIVFSILMIAYVLLTFSNLIPSLPIANYQRELIITASQIVFQMLFLLKIDSKTIINYVGNLMTVSLIGCLGILQLVLLNEVINIPEIIVVISFMGIVSLMFFEHKRRVKLLKLPNYLSYTWIIYRLIVLLIIINI
ncbi:hypothetical protein SAMN04487765_2205 [Tenacibaculum sp. MAR_2010_89]|uniref:hypothetical protein n=1 Tax=Tenacibaculum sp. MAR_2010_89 TaxID=1250198 RepID=UPI00089881BA|nr:hypothetical protein [Tenacibaculum sp. MAR_2010_89]SEE34265.1 hypothetical protein SAMN04487765_2205 [Tenacibaculum sp. MAR_2010_89]